MDGQLYFDRQADIAARPALEAEKKRLLAALGSPASSRRRAPAQTAGGGAVKGSGASPSASSPSLVAAPAMKSKPTTSPLTAIVGGTIHPVSGPDIVNGVLVMENGKIVAVGDQNTPVPAGAKKTDATGLHIYPGLIDADNEMGLTEIESIRATVDSREAGSFSPDLRTAVAVNPDSELIPVGPSKRGFKRGCRSVWRHNQRHGRTAQLGRVDMGRHGDKSGHGLVCQLPDNGAAQIP